MNKAKLPLSGNARKAALISSGLKNPELEEECAVIAREARERFGIPVAQVCLLDRDRQWFKAHCEEDDAKAQSPHMFCAYTILSDQVMVVPDATRDERFAQHPLVAKPPGIRFYAGAPIIVPDGLILGTLCVMDIRPRSGFTAQQQHQLALMAEQISGLIQQKVDAAASREDTL